MSDDKLFTKGLVRDVAKVIEEHGYAPFDGSELVYAPLDGRELVELQQHLFHFLHGRARGDNHCTGGVR